MQPTFTQVGCEATVYNIDEISFHSYQFTEVDFPSLLSFPMMMPTTDFIIQMFVGTFAPATIHNHSNPYLLSLERATAFSSSPVCYIDSLRRVCHQSPIHFSMAMKALSIKKVCQVLPFTLSVMYVLYLSPHCSQITLSVATST